MITQIIFLHTMNGDAETTQPMYAKITYLPSSHNSIKIWLLLLLVCIIITPHVRALDDAWVLRRKWRGGSIENECVGESMRLIRELIQWFQRIVYITVFCFMREAGISINRKCARRRRVAGVYVYWGKCVFWWYALLWEFKSVFLPAEKYNERNEERWQEGRGSRLETRRRWANGNLQFLDYIQ